MKRLFVISLLFSFMTSCKMVAVQQEYSFTNGRAVKVGKPQPFAVKEGSTFYRVYRKNIFKK